MVTLTVFISHSFANKPEFENVTDALDYSGVPYWRPSEIRSGESLREQLRSAVNTCSVCIFIATHHSVKSSWCGAELGAFWGAGTPTIVYLADSSLVDDALPPIVQGDVWERKLSQLAARANELVKSEIAEVPLPNARLSSITVEQLEKLVTGAISLMSARTGGESDSLRPPDNFESVASEAASRVLRGVKATSLLREVPDSSWKRHILWVDDRPDNNRYERGAFESFDVRFTLALTTDEALSMLKSQKFAAIISDMGRREGPREGYKLLEKVRLDDGEIPFFIYAGSKASWHLKEAEQLGAQGTTNDASELIDMVTAVLQ